MNTSEKPILPLSAIVIILLLTVSISSCQLIETERPTSYEGPESESVRQFAGDPNLQFEDRGVDDYPFGQTRRLVTTGTREQTSYQVDVETGEVRAVFHHDQQAETVEIDQEQARNLALDYARAHYPDFDTLNLTLVTDQLVDQGEESDKFYSFQWVRLDPDSGATLPFMARIRVNAATGEIASYTNLRQEVTVSTQPQIDEAQANAAALQAVAETLPQAQVESSALGVTALPQDEAYSSQMLLWQVMVTGLSNEMGYTPGALVFVNAHTGEVERVDPFAGTAWDASPSDRQATGSHYAFTSEQTPYRMDIYLGLSDSSFERLTLHASQALAQHIDEHGYDCITPPTPYRNANPDFALANLQNDIIFIATGHADAKHIEFDDNGVQYLHSSDIHNLRVDEVPRPLSDLQLALFIGCNTGSRYRCPEEAGIQYCGLLSISLGAGARTVIGFKDYIVTSQTEEWNENFWDYLLDDGMTIADAAIQAAEEVSGNLVWFHWYDLGDSIVVRGSGRNEPLDIAPLCESPPTTSSPNLPSEPFPADRDVVDSADINLSWVGGDPDGDAVTYDVYFGVGDDTPDTLVSDDQSDATYSPGTLTSGQDYYWRVVAKDEHGATMIGPVWEFRAGFPPPFDTLMLDLHQGSRRVAGPVYSSRPLEERQNYVIHVAGTFSVWSPGAWDTSMGWGEPEEAPMFPSPGRSNGRTGIDPFYLFAHFREYTSNQNSSPIRSNKFQISLDGGLTWFNPDPPNLVYQEDHHYEFEVTGEGVAAGFRRLDDPTYDNYVMLEIRLERTD